MSHVQCIMLVSRDTSQYSHTEDISRLSDKVGDFYDEPDAESDFIKSDSPDFINKLYEQINLINREINHNEEMAIKMKKEEVKRSEYLHSYRKYALLYGIPIYGCECIVDDTGGEFGPEEVEDMIKNPEQLKNYKGLLLINIHS